MIRLWHGLRPWYQGVSPSSCSMEALSTSLFLSRTSSFANNSNITRALASKVGGRRKLSRPEPVFSCALVGRPNVGKSTLFNRLTRSRLAIVHQSPGLTRDRREGLAQLGDLHFTVVDTAGVEHHGRSRALDDPMLSMAIEQSGMAVRAATLCLLLVDLRAGLTAQDRDVASWLRQMNVADKVILVANKAEGNAGIDNTYDFNGLGWGTPVAISAETGEGLVDLFDALRPHHDAILVEKEKEKENAKEKGMVEEGEGEETTGGIRCVLLGQPNVGKSTLANALVGESRFVTGPLPGVTRDAIDATFEDSKGQCWQLTDTAGVAGRTTAHVADKIVALSRSAAIRAMERGEVVLLLVDACKGLTRNDLKLAALTVQHGKPLVLVLNKVDLLGDNWREVAGEIGRALERTTSSLANVPIVAVSAKNALNVQSILPAAKGVYTVWNERIPTGLLNKFLDAVRAEHPSELKYITQVKTRPPTFTVFAHRPQKIKDSALKYLQRRLREEFSFWGCPIRLSVKSG
jgi:GTPase